MEDLRCSHCNHLFGKKVVLVYGEFKCTSCGALNIFDRSIHYPQVKVDKRKNNMNNGIIV